MTTRGILLKQFSKFMFHLMDVSFVNANMAHRDFMMMLSFSLFKLVSILAANDVENMKL